jgi:hypothetical protein
MIYAQIKNNIVVNTIILQDENLLPTFLVGFDALIRIDLLENQPSIGASYENGIFINAPEIISPNTWNQ